MKRNSYRNRQGGNRGGNRQSGGNSGGIRPFASPAVSSGPLMTNHLQELELELALLKRKREILETQQQMLVDDRFNRPNFTISPEIHIRLPSAIDPLGQGRLVIGLDPLSAGDYEQSQFYDDVSQSNPTHNFANFYNDAASDNHRSGGSVFDRLSPKFNQGSMAVWDNPPPAKRFRDEAPRFTRKPNPPAGPRARPEPKPKQGGSGGSGGSWPKREFQPTKVTKPKNQPKPPGGKPAAKPPLSSFSTEDRRKVVAQAKSAGLVTETVSEDRILREGKEPSAKVNGTLELGLGNIMKEVKILHGIKTGEQLSIHALQNIKQVIRDRIRAVMIGKEVRSGPAVVLEYRKQYPEGSDAFLLKDAKKAKAERAKAERAPRAVRRPRHLIDAEDPEKFFKLNFGKLLSNKLDQLFTKIISAGRQDVRKFHNKSTLDIIKSILARQGLQLEPNDPNGVISMPGELSEDNPIVVDADGDATAKVVSADVKEENAEEVDGTEANDVDKSTEQTGTDETKDKESNAEANNTAAEEKETDSPKETANPEAAASTEPMAVDDEGQPKQDSKENELPLHLNPEFYEEVLSVLLERKLPSVLPKFKSMIFDMLNTDIEYRSTLAYTIIATKKRWVNPTVKKETSASDTSDNNVASNFTPNNSQTEGPRPNILYVKIVGRPTLPKRAQMQAFLDQFHPASIKKHRGLHNLLFVGFLGREDFEGILAADKTVVGNCTLNISISERVKPKTNPVVHDQNSESAESQNESDVKLDSDLDSQITDLLQSIKSEEEKEAAGCVVKNENGEVKSETVKVENGNDDSGAKGPAEDNTVAADEAIPVDDDNLLASEDEVQLVEDPVQGGDAVQVLDSDMPAIEEQGEGMEVADAAKNGTGKATPARASARIATATPAGAVRTRRASRLAKDN